MVRCKFVCTSKTETQHWDRNKGKLYAYKFNPVTSGSEENQQFYAATPAGCLDVSTVTDGRFEVGKEYYLDLSLAE